VLIPTGLGLHGITGGAWPIKNNGFPPTKDIIKQAGLADIGSADNSYNRYFGSATHL
jgi:hypothetical protein